MSLFINHSYIEETLKKSINPSAEDIRAILKRAEKREGLSHEDLAQLLQCEDQSLIQEMFKAAGKIKDDIYGDRVVMFAPLYVSDYCVNSCTYCGYKHCNEFGRRKLTMDEIRQEVRILEKMGHKRLAFEAGEDPANCPMDYVLEAIKTIYETYHENGNIRRINVNIASTTVENYKLLKDAEIGTYILFQETYNKPAYENYHPTGPKHNYDYHLTAFDRAMEAGIDDVGGGVLFGLYDYKFEVMGLMLHNEHLEAKYNVGFHTISVPRLRPAEGVDLEQYPHMLSDDEFKKVIAIIRLAVPFTGMILSTRESAEMRKQMINCGISQVSAGSCTGVGSYKEHEEGNEEVTQFITEDHRSPLEVIKSLIDDGLVPSYCTACYRSERTGDRFMQLAKSGSIKHVCGPNALMTLMEYIQDYGDDELHEKGRKLIYEHAEAIEREDIKKLLLANLEKIENGERDLFL